MLWPWVEQGWSVTAVVPDPLDHRVVSRSIALAGEAVTLVASEDELPAEASFDLVVGFEGVLWSGLTHEARVEIARRLRGRLRPGGRLVLEGPNMPWVLRSEGHPPAVTELYHRAQISRIPSDELDYHAGVLVRRETFVADVPDQEPVEWQQVHRWALMGLPLLALALRHAGLHEVETYRDLRATGPGRVTGPRIVLTARPSGSASPSA